jgi:hypothetical protein
MQEEMLGAVQVNQAMNMSDLKAAIAAANQSTDRSAAIASEVVESAPMAKRTVNRIMEAGEAAAKVMRFRL